jgi:hypothetical protein
VVALAGVMAACARDLPDADPPVTDPLQSPTGDLRIYRNPYGDVDWSKDLRLKAQHHDHVARTFALPLITAYDAAGYDVLSLMDYSGKPSVFYSLRERPWPPERWIPQSILAALVNIKLFVPNAEEIGSNMHATSPFLTTYIEGAPTGAPIEPWQYRDVGDLLRLVHASGGLMCLAHPFAYSYEHLEGLRCVEIYNAFAEAAKTEMPGNPLQTYDGNAALLANWDRALQRNQDILGIAVNDHFGPGIHATTTLLPQVLDSGKIIVLAKAATLVEYRSAFERGAFLAIRDQGIVKDRYPTIFSISVGATFVSIESNGNVAWKNGTSVVADGPVLNLAGLPANTKYVRAEITANDGSIVFTQAFVVRPTGDVDADYDVDPVDAAICDAVTAALEVRPVRVAACEAATRP